MTKMTNSIRHLLNDYINKSIVWRSQEAIFVSAIHSNQLLKDT